jgi:hypothetical protein
MVLLLVLGLSLGAYTPTPRPHVSVADQSPFTVRGWNFHAGEHIRVVVNASNHVMKKVTAGAAGGFVVRLKSVRIGDCPRYGIRATGDKGSQASFKLVSECPNLVPAGP